MVGSPATSSKLRWHGIDWVVDPRCPRDTLYGVKREFLKRMKPIAIEDWEPSDDQEERFSDGAGI